ncbi:MAG: ATP-binding cassette domain-containing protein [Pseudomonadota bacterium]
MPDTGLIDRPALSTPDAVSAPVLRADAVSLSLGSRAGLVDILFDVSLSIETAQSVGIVGRSGSGKSSLLSLLAGLEKPTGGAVFGAGLDLTQLDEDGLARYRRDHVGIVFQSFHLIPTMTALENVALPLELTGAPEATPQARQLLEDVGLGKRVDHYPDQLSGGEQQRVAIARALIGKPGIILADEPTGNLDAAVGTQIADLLFSLQRASGAALVMVTHDLDLAQRCDRVVTMADGRLSEGEAV